MDFDDRTIPAGRAPGDRSRGVAAKLVVLQGDIRGQILDLTDRELRIGRQDDNDLVLASEKISRHHARVYRSEGGFFCEDLGSFNGSSLNGRAMTPREPQRLRHQDTLQLCDHQLLFLERGGTVGKLDLSTIHLDATKVREEAEQALRDFLEPGTDG
ncbi:MAG: FHA domain-containing protein [Planctomycetota bacterium]